MVEYQDPYLKKQQREFNHAYKRRDKKKIVSQFLYGGEKGIAFITVYLVK